MYVTQQSAAHSPMWTAVCSVEKTSHGVEHRPPGFKHRPPGFNPSSSPAQALLRQSHSLLINSSSLKLPRVCF